MKQKIGLNVILFSRCNKLNGTNGVCSDYVEAFIKNGTVSFELERHRTRANHSGKHIEHTQTHTHTK